MTIEQILEMSPDELEKMTDEELIKHFTPYFDVTRPELCVRPTNGVRRIEPPQLSFKAKQNIEKLKELGIDFDASYLKRKR